MRKIGSVPDRAQAEVLGAYLYSQGIANDVDVYNDDTWAVWIHADENIDQASCILSEFLDDPDDSRFQQGAGEGQKKLQQEEAKDERWKKNYYDRSRVFRTIRMGLVTATLIAFSVIIAIVTNFGRDFSMSKQLFISAVPAMPGAPVLPELRAGQAWRLVTPIFLHFGYLHLLFNMLWMYDLGNLLERRHGPLRLICFVLLVALPSNLLQYFFSGPAFGGMSGVVYALLGFFWARPRSDPGYGLHLKSSTVTLMGIWFVLCIVVPQFNVANLVHAVGLVMGLIIGYLSGLLVTRTAAGGDPVFSGVDPFELILWYVAFLLSTTLHEAAHSWAAMKGGDLTAYMGGQVSLDPSPHIRREPFGMVILPVLSLLINGWPFGFASAPYDPYWAERHPKRASLMALAGPSANMALVLLSACIIWSGIFVFQVFENPDSAGLATVVVAGEEGFWEAAAMLISIMFSLNLILAVLNMIPFPPLDGSSVLELFLSERRAQRWRDFTRRPGFSIMGLLLAWHLFGILFDPVFKLALLILYPWTRYG